VPTDHVFIGGAMAQGAAHPGALAMELRDGLEEADAAAPDFQKALPFTSVIERDGGLWRNDGAGWSQAEVSPGFGMDQVTAQRLPGLLRRMAAVQDLGPDAVNGRALHHYAGTADAADWPGVIAADGVLFTASPIRVDVWLDADGQLARLHGQALNLNETTHLQVVDTTVDFHYDNIPSIGLPVPTASPRPAPGSEPPTSLAPSATAVAP
jgi:hypothetical protein